MEEHKNRAPAVSAAIKVIEYMSEAREAVSLAEISSATGINKNMISRTLSTLIDSSWAVLDEADFLSIRTGKPSPRLMATDDAKWEGVVSTTTDFIRGFFLGGAPALSCNLTRLSRETKDTLRAIIADHKQNRGFFTHAACRILANGDGVLCLQYSRSDYHRIVVFSQTTHTPAVTVYPELSGENYLINGTPRTGADIRKNGITFALGHQTADILAISPVK